MTHGTPQHTRHDGAAVLQFMLTWSSTGGPGVKVERLTIRLRSSRTWVPVRRSQGARRGLVKRSFGGDAPMTNAMASIRQTMTVGINRTVQQIPLRRKDRPRPTGLPSRRRTTRRPVSRKLAVRPCRHSSTLHTVHPIPRVTTKRRHVRRKARRRALTLASGARRLGLRGSQLLREVRGWAIREELITQVPSNQALRSRARSERAV